MSHPSCVIAVCAQNVDNFGLFLESLGPIPNQERTRGRFDTRAPRSVNSVLTAVMAFLRYCERHFDVDPPLPKLDVDEVMKGRQLTEDEYKAMLEAVPAIVAELPSASWRFVFEILWESAFRVRRHELLVG